MAQKNPMARFLERSRTQQTSRQAPVPAQTTQERAAAAPTRRAAEPTRATPRELLFQREEPRNTPTLPEKQAQGQHDKWRAEGKEVTGNGIVDWWNNAALPFLTSEYVGPMDNPKLDKQGVRLPASAYWRDPNSDPSYVKQVDERTGTTLEERQQSERNSAPGRLLPGLSGFTTQELSSNEMERYNARQRSAIEFNTALQNAVQADRELFGEQADEEYLSSVEAMFGADGGSERYAPNTMKLLSMLGYRDTERGDLDNFLDLNALVTEDEVNRLGSDKFKPAEDDARNNFAIQISEAAQASLSAVLAQGQTLLDSFQAATTVNPNLETAFAQENMNNFLNLAMQGALEDSDISEWYGFAEQEFGVPANEIAEYMDRVSGSELYASGTPAFNQEQLARFFGRETV